MPYNIVSRKPVGYWTLAVCKKDALKHATRGAWRNAGGGYQTARKKGWIDECCKHMTPLNISWTEEKCKADAAKYPTRKRWFNESSGYQAAKRNGWFEACVTHMPVKSKQ